MNSKKEVVTIKMPPIQYDIENAVIEKMEEEYLPLKVTNFEDKDGYQKVREARIVVKNTRVQVEKKRKGLKADALEYGKNVDAEANRIKSRLEPIEKHLQTQEDVVKKEKERREQERQEKIKQLCVDRASELMRYGSEFDGVNYRCGDDSVKNTDLGVIDEDIYLSLLEKAKQRKVEKDAVEAEEERKRKEEEERQEVIRKEQEAKQAEIDRVQREQEEAAAKIKADQEALEAEKARIKAEEQRKIYEQKRLEELEVAKKKAAEEAKKQAEEDEKRQQQEKIEAEKVRIAEEERQEQLKPDKKKLIEFADKLCNVKGPELKNKKAQNLLNQKLDILKQIAADIKEKSKKL